MPAQRGLLSGRTLCGVCFAGTLVISEFMANPSGTDSQGEWIELTNTGTVAIRRTP